jgi:hypothetical protein
VDSNTAYLIITDIANQFQRGNIGPARFNRLINQASTSFLDYLCGQMQQYQYGAPQSRVQYAVNETARLRLTPMIDPVTTLTIDNTGLSPYPTGFEQVDAMYMNNPARTRIRFVPQHKLPNYLSDPIDPIDTNPIYILESGGFRFYPSTDFDGTNLGTSLISYVHTPPVIVWAYTLDGQGRPQYTTTGSVGLPWYDVDCLEVLSRFLKMIGVNLGAPEISQYAQGIIDKGQ